MKQLKYIGHNIFVALKTEKIQFQCQKIHFHTVLTLIVCKYDNKAKIKKLI